MNNEKSGDNVVAKVNQWIGDDFTAMSIRGNELNDFLDFCNSHEEVYIFGAGKIGKAIRHYMNQSGIACAGFITSEKINEFTLCYKKRKTGVIIGVNDSHLQEITPLLSKFVADSDVFLLSSDCRELMGRQLSSEYMRENFWINVFVTNRCNLNCESCSTFSPITPLCKLNTDYDINVFNRDIQQLHSLNLPAIKVFKFTGGETLLHQNLFDMFVLVRKFFPQTDIECYTNGILLEKMEKTQLNMLKDLSVTLTITEYPLSGLNINNIYKTLDENGINYQVISYDKQKMFFKRSLNIDKATPKHCYFECLRYIICNSLFLYNSKLWKCIYSFNSVFLNEVFNTNFELVKGDYLDLFETTTSEIYDFAISRIPFCGYCNPITELIPWGLSKREIEEWVYFDNETEGKPT